MTVVVLKATGGRTECNDRSPRRGQSRNPHGLSIWAMFFRELASLLASIVSFHGYFIGQNGCVLWLGIEAEIETTAPTKGI